MPGLLEGMKALAPPPDVREGRREPLLQVSLLIPARGAGETLRGTVAEAHRYLSARYPGSFEIVVIPNSTGTDPTAAVAGELEASCPGLRSVPHQGAPGKGAALRTGFLASRGRWIFFTDADLPYDLSFFDEAALKLRSGYALVSGNRRLPISHFRLPVELLGVAHGRHRLGMGFNRLVRLAFPIETTDTQAGIKAMTRELAQKAFFSQACPGFFFDLELFLTARAQGAAATELPVTLRLETEKSTVRVLRESVLAAFWLLRLKWRSLRGVYGPARRPSILRRYRGADLGTRLFLWLRWRLTPYARMAARLPPSGRVLDLGCGHGLFALSAALHRPERQVLGVDHDPARVALAVQASGTLGNLRFAAGSLSETPPGGSAASGEWNAIALIDVLHYFEPATQRRLLESCHARLRAGGRVLVREVEPRAGLVSRLNRLYERVATAIGFTRSESAGLFFRAREEWIDLLRQIGFSVSSERCSHPIFADVLFVAEKADGAKRRPGPRAGDL